jgi:hypothetical protein
MVRQILILIFLTLTISSYSFGQTNTNKFNTLYVELGGNGLFLSANYERQILKNTRLNLHFGTGIYGVKPSILTIPFGVNYLLKLKKVNSYIDFGFGVTYTKADVKLYTIVHRSLNSNVNSDFINIIPSIGIRHQTRKNFMYRFSLTPVFNQYEGLPFFGCSIGKSF